MLELVENVTVNGTLAVRLLISRRDLKFNQEDVADRAGVSRAYVSDLERGKVDEELARRAEAATDAPAWLAGYTSRMRDNTVALGTVIGRWMRGETTSATIQEELAPVRSACEWALSDLLDELGRAGVSQAEIDALEAQVLEVMSQPLRN